MSGESLATTYVLGLVYGIGGFCSGPLLGGVLTIAGASGGALAGALLLAIFAAGMAAPLLILALVWDRVGAAGRGRLRGRDIQIGPIRRHSSVVISSALFIGLGVAFIAFQGSNAFSGLYQAVGAADLALTIESGVRAVADRAPWLLAAMVGLPVVALVTIIARPLVRRDHRTPESGE